MEYLFSRITRPTSQISCRDYFLWVPSRNLEIFCPKLLQHVGVHVLMIRACSTASPSHFYRTEREYCMWSWQCWEPTRATHQMSRLSTRLGILSSHLSTLNHSPWASTAYVGYCIPTVNPLAYTIYVLVRKDFILCVFHESQTMRTWKLVAVSFIYSLASER